MTFSVLVIDDDDVDQQAIKRALLKPGRKIHIEAAATGADALAHMGKARFDCVLLDYLLPDMDGVSFLQKIYNVEADLTPSPVVMLTGQGSESVMADALRWGAQDYAVKGNITHDTLDIAMMKAHEIYELKKNRHQAEVQLRHAQKMEAVGQLTSGIAHDFNNLLTVILGNTRILNRRLDTENAKTAPLAPADILKNVKSIDDAAKRGAELVRRLMVFTRQRVPEATVTDVNHGVSETAELLSRTLTKSIDVRMSLGEDIWPTCFDAGQFENALINLSINAKDAMPNGGTLTIETRNVAAPGDDAMPEDMADGPYVMISVADTGCGMPPEVAQRVFEPFFTTKEVGKGTGLGLSMVYGFVRQSGGHIQVRSEVNKGTEFRIYLPKYVSEARFAASEEYPPPVQETGIK